MVVGVRSAIAAVLTTDTIVLFLRKRLAWSDAADRTILKESHL